jgi:MFS family permease
MASYVPSLLQMSYEVPGWLAGMALGPMVLGMLVVSIITTRIVGRTGSYTKLPVIGSAITGVAMLLAYLFGASMGPIFIVFCLFLGGVGLGNYVQLNLTLTQAYSKAEFLGSITSTFSVVRDMSGSIVSTIAGGIFGFGVVSILTKLQLPAGLDPASLSPAAIAGLDAGLKAQVQQAYADAFHPIFLNSALAYLVIFLLALTLPKIKLKTS